MSEKNIKKTLIHVVYEMLKEKRPDEIKARAVAEATGCTAAAIYNHFSGLDHLISIACIRFLESYIVDYQNVMTKDMDILEQAYSTWEIFARYAFHNVDVFERLFISNRNEKTGDLIFEYYQMFPDEWKRLDGFYSSMFFESRLEDRNRYMIKRISALGYFRSEDVEAINQLECYTFYGMLEVYKNSYRQHELAEKAIAEFMALLDRIIRQFRIA